MPSAVDFLPAYIMEVMNLVTTVSPNLASGRTSRFRAARRRDIPRSLLRPLRAVLRPALATILHALGVERAADDVVTDTGQVLDATAADPDHRVLLQIVPLAGDVGGHLEAIGQAPARNLRSDELRVGKESVSPCRYRW